MYSLTFDIHSDSNIQGSKILLIQLYLGADLTLTKIGPLQMS